MVTKSWMPTSWVKIVDFEISAAWAFTEMNMIILWEPEVTRMLRNTQAQGSGMERLRHHAVALPVFAPYIPTSSIASSLPALSRTSKD